MLICSRQSSEGESCAASKGRTHLKSRQGELPGATRYARGKAPIGPAVRKGQRKRRLDSRSAEAAGLVPVITRRHAVDPLKPSHEPILNLPPPPVADVLKVVDAGGHRTGYRRVARPDHRGAVGAGRPRAPTAQAPLPGVRTPARRAIIADQMVEVPAVATPILTNSQVAGATQLKVVAA